MDLWFYWLLLDLRRFVLYGCGDVRMDVQWNVLFSVGLVARCGCLCDWMDLAELIYERLVQKTDFFCFSSSAGRSLPDTVFISTFQSICTKILRCSWDFYVLSSDLSSLCSKDMPFSQWRRTLKTKPVQKSFGTNFLKFPSSVLVPDMSPMFNGCELSQGSRFVPETSWKSGQVLEGHFFWQKQESIVDAFSRPISDTLTTFFSRNEDVYFDLLPELDYPTNFVKALAIFIPTRLGTVQSTENEHEKNGLSEPKSIHLRRSFRAKTDSSTGVCYFQSSEQQ